MLIAGDHIADGIRWARTNRDRGAQPFRRWVAERFRALARGSDASGRSLNAPLGAPASHVQILHFERVLFDVVASLLDILAHEYREEFVRFGC